LKLQEKDLIDHSGVPTNSNNKYEDITSINNVNCKHRNTEYASREQHETHTLRHSQNCGLFRLKKLFCIAISYFHFNYKNATLDFTAIQSIL